MAKQIKWRAPANFQMVQYTDGTGDLLMVTMTPVEGVDTDFAGLNVWARTCTGQAISADGVVQKIYQGMMSPVGASA